MKDLDISKLFWSKCRTKLLEKFLLEYESWNIGGFHMRALSRDLDEQINSVKRELDNLSAIWFLKHRDELKKKIFSINQNFFILDEFISMFLKTYNPLNKIKDFFKSKDDLELIIINEAIKNKLTSNWKNILDIFLIWEIDKEELSNFLGSIFYWRKVKFAIITTEDFFKRLEFWDKLIKNIITESGNIFLKDNLKIKEKMNTK